MTDEKLREEIIKILNIMFIRGGTKGKVINKLMSLIKNNYKPIDN